MSATFPEYKGLNLPNVADEMLKFWEDHDIFNKSITSREGKPPYVFFEGPPSALRKTPSFLNFPYVCPRACLGKLIGFSIKKWRDK